MLRNVKIGFRLVAGLVLMIVLFSSVIAYGINRMYWLSKQTSMIHKHPFTVSNAVLRINTNIIKIHRSMKDIALAHDDNQHDTNTIKEDSRKVDMYEKEIYKDFEIINDRFLGEKGKYKKALQMFQDWKSIRDEVTFLMLNGKTREASDITKEKGARHVVKIEKAMEALGEFAQAKAETFLSASEKTVSSSLWMMILFFSTVIVIGIIATYFLSRSIILPLNILRNATDDIRKGNLNKRINVTSKDELGELGETFNKMTEELDEKQQQLIHADRLSSLGTMSAGIAHEINNPTSFISNNLQIFERLWEKSIKSSIEETNNKNEDKNLSFALDEMPKMITTMKNGVRRITNIVSNLNSFSRKTEGVFESANILDIIKKAVEFSRFDTNVRHKIKIELDLAEDIPNISLNKQEIEQVLVNLLVNANHAMEEITDGRELLLKIKALSINKNILIEITDTGDGIDKKALNHIFDSFFTTKKSGKGTGLGLSICHGIINKHKGTIKAASKPGEGTTFAITLPIDPYKKNTKKK